MTLLLVAMTLLGGGALVVVAFPAVTRHRLIGEAVTGVVTLACFLGAGAAAFSLIANRTEDFRRPWSVPYGSLSLHLDPLAALFLLPIFVLGGLGMVYGREYVSSADRQRRPSGWAWYYLFIATMALVVLASNAILFLAAWEAMSIAAFFLITTDDDDPVIRHAGWTFLVAAHIGTGFLFAMFAILGRGAANMDFDQLHGASAGAPAAAVFLLALAGFGTKAGLVPGHVWLPAAHPAAPSHVSAVLSGAMLKTGIYGLLRILTLLPAVPDWAGALLVVVGMVSGLFGIIFAMAQRDLKRLLADSSIENLGLITVGIGIGLIGVQQGSAAVTVLGFSGALLHVVNHALFKGLLFLNAGAVVHATGTRDIEHLGGLLRVMPWTGGLFLFGAAAVAALPPLNGFASEFLLYLAAFDGIHTLDRQAALLLVGVIFGLALVGGLAAATFLKAALAFVGTPRTTLPTRPHDPGWAMRAPMLALAAMCAVIGFAPFLALRALRPVLVQVSGLPASTVATEASRAGDTLTRVSLTAGLLVVFVLTLTLLRRWLLAGRTVASAETWGTAYLAPTPRMQYTGSSFVQPLVRIFRSVLQVTYRGGVPSGYFPREGAFSTETPGLFRERVFVPVFAGAERVAVWLRWLQHGRIQLYLLNIAAAFLVLLIWKLGVAQ